MAWMELIKARTVSPPNNLLDEIVAGVQNQAAMLDGLLVAKIYSNLRYPGELCVALLWESKCANEDGSRLGLSILEEFKKLGPADHSLWQEHATAVGSAVE